LNVPETMGVPLRVRTFPAHAAEIPAGSPVGVPIPVAPVVARVMAVSAVLIQRVGFEDAVPGVLIAVTVIVPVAFTAPQPPVKGML
jgi:hypothetical protein